MSWKGITAKGTVWGVLTAAVTAGTLLAVSSLLLARDALPESSMVWTVYVSVAAGCHLGGAVAMRHGGSGLQALAVCAVCYLAMWLCSLGGEGGISFGQRGLILTACVWGGGLMALLTRRRKALRKSAVRRRTSGSKTRKRAVT